MSAYEDFYEGVTLLRNNRLEEAIEKLEKARRKEPGKGSIREALARAYFLSGDFQKAASEFKKAIEIDPTNHYAHFGYGLSMIRLGERALGIGHLKLARAMSPENEDYRIYLEAYLSYE